MGLLISLLMIASVIQGAHLFLVDGNKLHNYAHKDFECPEMNGVYPTEEPCTEFYYVCSAGTYHLENCPAGYVFDPNVLSCRLEEESSCATTTVESTTEVTSPAEITTETFTEVLPPAARNCNETFECPIDEANGFYGIPCKVCSTQYYACVDGSLYTLTCPESLVFNPVEVSCVDPSQLPECSEITTVINPW